MLNCPHSLNTRMASLTMCAWGSGLLGLQGKARQHRKSGGMLASHDCMSGFLPLHVWISSIACLEFHPSSFLSQHLVSHFFRVTASQLTFSGPAAW